MFLNNLMDNRQAESCSFVFSALVFGREKWVENVFKIGLLNSLTGILNFDVGPDFSSRLHHCAGLNTQPPARSCHRVYGIEEEIEQDLFNLLSIQHDTRQVRRQLFFNLDPTAIRLHVDEIETGGDNIVEILVS